MYTSHYTIYANLGEQDTNISACLIMLHSCYFNCCPNVHIYVLHEHDVLSILQWSSFTSNVYLIFFIVRKKVKTCKFVNIKIY